MDLLNFLSLFGFCPFVSLRAIGVYFILFLLLLGLAVFSGLLGCIGASM